jgi:hypothetical protein
MKGKEGREEKEIFCNKIMNRQVKVLPDALDI